MLSHIFRSQDRSMLIIDEPDIYLHPNPQRQLLSILKDSAPDVLMATHSSEIVAEADASDLLVIDKTQRSAKRVRSPEGIQSTMGSLGSVHTAMMSAIAQTRRILYVEGDDFKMLRNFAQRLGMKELGAGVGIAPFPLGGFPSIQRLKAVNLGVSESIAGPILCGGIFDRDFRPDEEITALRNAFNQELTFSTILGRKEIENYLLVPDALDRALGKALMENIRREGESITVDKSMSDILREITTPMKAEVQSQYIAKREEYFSHTRKDRSTISREAIELFDPRWDDDHQRLHIVPGKKVLSELFSIVQTNYKVNLTTAKIMEQLRGNEIPWDLRQTLKDLESFRCRVP